MNIPDRFSNRAIQCVKYVQSSLSTRIPEQFQEFFRTEAPKHVIARAPGESAFIRAKRFAENDSSFSRVYPLINQLSDEERLELAKIAIISLSGKTDCCNFVRNALGVGGFDLKPEGKAQIIEILDKKTKGFVTQSLNAQFGIGPEGKSKIANELDNKTGECVTSSLKAQYRIK